MWRVFCLVVVVGIAVFVVGMCDVLIKNVSCCGEEGEGQS